MKFLFFLLLLSVSSISYAAIYQQTDDQGNIVYTDAPTGHAKKVNVPQTSEIQSSKPAQSQVTQNNDPSLPTNEPAEAGEKALENKPYTLFAIDSPKDQETLPNQPIINVSVKLEPELKKGDKIQVFLDGAAVGKPVEGTRFELSLVERGTHQLYAVLFDSNNQILKKTVPVTIYVHRNSIITSPASQ